MGLSITWCLFPNRMNEDRTSYCKQALIVTLVACAHNPVIFIDSGCKIKAQTSVNVQDNERDLDG